MPRLQKGRGGLEETTRRLVAVLRPRAKSLISTVLGDAVVPHGGVVWIGTLIRWLAPFGVNERAVRTGVQRLCTDGWLSGRSTGRKSDYALTDVGRHHFADAERRIYAAEPPPWSGEWCLVLLPPDAVPPARRDAARRVLRWHGFGEAAPSVLLHPEADLEELHAVLDELDLRAKAVVLRARDENGVRAESLSLRALAGSAWDLTDLTAEYAGYVRRFGALAERLSGPSPPEGALAFRIRILAVHEYRRILLRDPRLPRDVLPEDWVGSEAHRTCERIYRRVERAAREWVMATGETSAGPLPPAGELYRGRFGGLGRTSA